MGQGRGNFYDIMTPDDFSGKVTMHKEKTLTRWAIIVSLTLLALLSLSAGRAVGGVEADILESWIEAKTLETILQGYMVEAEGLQTAAEQGGMEPAEFMEEMEELALLVEELYGRLSIIPDCGDRLFEEILERQGRNFERYQAFIRAIADYVGMGDYAQGERAVRLLEDIESDEDIIKELEGELYARLSGGG